MYMCVCGIRILCVFPLCKYLQCIGMYTSYVSYTRACCRHACTCLYVCIYGHYGYMHTTWTPICSACVHTCMYLMPYTYLCTYTMCTLFLQMYIYICAHKHACTLCTLNKLLDMYTLIHIHAAYVCTLLHMCIRFKR